MNKTIKLITLLVTLLFTTVSIADEAAQCATNGIDYISAQHFVTELQQAIKTDNKNKVATLAMYPVKIHSTTSAGKVNTLSITNKAALIAKYNQIFSQKIKNMITSDDAKNIFCNWQGAMIANGLIWFQSNEKEQGFFVINLP